MDPLDWPRCPLLDCLLRHLQRDTHLLIYPQHFVCHLHLVVHLWSHEHFLATSELEDTMEFTTEEGGSRCQLRHHDGDVVPNDRRTVHIIEGSH